MRRSKENIPVEIEKDLANSGLTWEDVKKYGWYELPLIGNPTEELKRILGF